MGTTDNNWTAVSKLLDAALDIPAAERDAWLENLTGDDAKLRPALRDLLAKHAQLDAERFLEDSQLIGAMGGLRDDVLQPSESLAGTAIGPYRLTHEIGRGGMGSVWRAERADGRYQGSVAVKFVQTSWLGKQGEERFRTEGKLLARFDHPNIARLIDAGVLGRGQPYLLLEYVDGAPITEYCARHDLDLEQRIQLFLSVLAAVSHAHSHLIVHRDLKPANIFVTREGVVKLLDFGIGKLIDASADTDVTKTSLRALTPQFAAPEQLLGQAITTSIDVYALGLVLYTLLTGTHPIATQDMASAELQRQILVVEAPRPSSVAALPAIPARALRGDLDNILGKALKKPPAERYASVEAFADDLNRYLRHEPVQARADSLLYHLSKFVRRHRQGVALAALAVIAVLAGVIGTVYQARRAEASALQAARSRERAMNELSYAQAANEMLYILLDKRSNKVFTPGELQERGRAIVNAQFADNPGLRARMLLALAETFAEDEKAEAAAPLFAEARAAAAPLDDVPLQAQIDCSIAAEDGDTGNYKRSLELYDSAISRLRGNENTEPDVLAACLSGRGAVTDLAGDPTAALPDEEAALRLLGQPGPGQLTLAIGIRVDLAKTHAQLGHEVQALQEYAEAVQALRRSGRGDSEFATGILNDYGVALAKAGQWKKAAEMYSQGLSASKGRGEASEIAPNLEGNYAKILIDLGQLDEAQQLFSSALASAQHRKHPRSIMMNLLLSAPAWCARADLVECDKRLTQAASMMKEQLPPGHTTFGTLELERAQLAVAQHQPALAREHIESALKVFEAAKVMNPNELRVTSFRPTVDLLLGDKQAAALHAAEAVRRAKDASAGFSSSAWVGNALLTQALVFKASGEVQQATNTFRQAADQLRDAVGEDAPATRQALAELH